jgi:hypothetical protein
MVGRLAIGGEVRISRCSGLSRHPAPTKRVVSQSSSSGCDGVSPSRPKSLELAASPRPKWYCQTRLTITAVERGLSGRVSQRAARPAAGGAWGRGEGLDLRRPSSRTVGNPGATGVSPFFGMKTGGASGPTSVTASGFGNGRGFSPSNAASFFRKASSVSLSSPLIRVSSRLYS